MMILLLLSFITTANFFLFYIQGQAVCSHYNLYGLCKYGPTCRFDHPVTGYSSYNYCLSLPPLSIFDPSLIPYQRNSSTIHSSETSPSKTSKFPDWVQKPESGSTKSQNPDTKAPEGPPEQAGSLQHSSPNSSEPPQDQSDWSDFFFVLFHFFHFVLSTF